MSEKTSKTVKSALRDKPKHSSGGASNKAKRDAGWGKPLDELKANFDDGALDSGDPNYVKQEKQLWSPRAAPRRRFEMVSADLHSFKSDVREAGLTYLDLGNAAEFAAAVRGLGQPLFLQEVPYVLLKLGMEEGPEQLTRILKLLQLLHAADGVAAKDEPDNPRLLSVYQLEQGFRKLGNSLPELVLDVPRARMMFDEAVAHGLISGYLTAKVGDELRRRAAHLGDDAELVQYTKGLLRDLIVEYFESADSEELQRGAADLRASWLHPEIIKTLVSCAMDRDQAARELASQAIAHLSGGELVSMEDTEHAFAVLLERVEDLSLDVPRVLELLSCFLARAIADEAISPGFLLRVDLVGREMGSQVIQQTQRLLALPRLADRLAEVWAQPLQPLSPSSGDSDGHPSHGRGLLDSDSEEEEILRDAALRRRIIPPPLAGAAEAAEEPASAGEPRGDEAALSWAERARRADIRSRNQSEAGALSEDGSNGRSRQVSEIQV